MKNKITIATLLLLLFAGSITAAWGQSAQGLADHAAPPAFASDTSRHIDAAIYFRIGKGDIDPEFEGNKFRLSIFVSKLKAVLADPDYEVSRMVVVGTASPDGKESVNIALAGRRAQALADYLKTHTSLPADKIEVVNGGENWTGLRMMIEASKEMPYREKMLELIAIPDQKTRKQQMMYYAHSEPWSWMHEHFFNQLRIGAGDTYRRVAQSKLSLANWARMPEVIHTTSLDDQTKRALLATIDHEPDAALRMSRLRELCSDAPTYALLQEQIVVGLLSQQSALSTDNWTLLREKVAASDIPDKTDILNIIDTTSVTRGREKALRSLNEGSVYRVILDRFLPNLLITDRAARSEHDRPVSEQTPLGAQNWRYLREMIAVSDMPGKDSVLYLIDNEPDIAAREQRLRSLDNGYSYRYINEVFFPELLYGISSAAKENWQMMTLAVEESDMPHKERILEIVQTTAPGLEREEAIRALDEGESWRRMGEIALPELLQGTESVALTGSGMSLYYELSPQAKERAAAMTQPVAAQDTIPSVEQSAAQAAQAAPTAQTPQPSATSPRKSAPLFWALKTDLMLWGGVMPGFKMGTWTPNLSAEVYFARRWSAQAGYAYATWSALSAGKGLYSLSSGDLEVRRWFGKPSRYKGFYLGLYGSYGQYDVQQDAVGQTGSFWSAGLGAGWLQPLSRHWALEAEIRGGYRSANNDLYDIEPGHDYYNRRQTVGKFSPQMRLQVVYRFGKSGK